MQQTIEKFRDNLQMNLQNRVARSVFIHFVCTFIVLIGYYFECFHCNRLFVCICFNLRCYYSTDKIAMMRNNREMKIKYLKKQKRKNKTK